MLKREYIKDKLYQVVENAIESGAQEFGIEYSIKAMYMYGSTLTGKANPGDIDVFVEINSISSDYAEEFQYDLLNSDLSEKDQFEYFLTNRLHDYVHGEYIKLHQQPEHGGKRVDINVCNHEYAMAGKKIELKEYCKLNNALPTPKKEKKSKSTKQGRLKF